MGSEFRSCTPLQKSGSMYATSAEGLSCRKEGGNRTAPLELITQLALSQGIQF